MPSYTMRHKETEETKEVILSISERETWLEENPEWEQALSTPSFVTSTTSTLKRAGSGWSDVLNKVKSGSGRNNTIKT